MATSSGLSMREIWLQQKEARPAQSLQHEPRRKTCEPSRFLHLLEPTDYSGENSPLAKHLAAHVQGTGDWLPLLPEFQTWKSDPSPDSGLLWISGPAGSGKSVMAAMAIQQLRQDNARLLYFFFQKRIEPAQTRNDIMALRDCVHQIVPYSAGLQKMLDSTYMLKFYSVRGLSTEDMWQYLRVGLAEATSEPDSRPWFMIVDALNEIDDDVSAKQFTDAIIDLGRWKPGRVKVLATSRFDSPLADNLRRKCRLEISLSSFKREMDNDISAYVQHRLAQFKLDKEHHTSVQNKLCALSNGSILYARLAMDRLCHCKTNLDLEQLLAEFPSDLEQLYYSILRHGVKITRVPPATQRLILQLVTHSMYPLQLPQVAQCLKFSEPETFRNRATTQVEEMICRLCSPLLQTSSNGTIDALDYSFVEFLTDKTRRITNGEEEHLAGLDYGSTHQVIALQCLNYLESFGLSELTLGKNPTAYGNRGFIYEEFWHMSGEVSGFCQYSGKRWFLHVQKSEATGIDQSQVVAVLDRLMIGDNISKLFGMARYFLKDYVLATNDPLYVALTLGLIPYAKHIIERPEYISPGDTNIPVLAYAAERGHVEVVRALLEHSKVVQVDEFDSRVLQNQTALHYAAANNYSEIVRLLLNAGADPHLWSVNRDGSNTGPAETTQHTAIKIACQRGSLDSLREMLPSITTSKDLNKAIAWAAGSGCAAVVEFLVSQPLAQVNEQLYGMTPLMHASMMRFPACIKHLLDSGADATISSSEQIPRGYGPAEAGCTAIHYWTRDDLRPFSGFGSHSETQDSAASLSLLTRAGGDLNARDANGNPPLYRVKRLETAKLLLEAGADCTGFELSPMVLPEVEEFINERRNAAIA
ncbi:hypothetical protein QQS21_005869 [Conoideocrella luteorostrata]|uniref:Peptidase A2 domain-containing protein n=1 Tax=Conoideocrella luteorostrata TaxID=1105319 RepID=A0AAJ0CR58_9HYPO|nr:hypothetical protein QQS21_005869 [Conoideocrella luteorostrata]